MGKHPALNRRQFLQFVSAAAVGGAVTSCTPTARLIAISYQTSPVWGGGNFESFRLLKRLTYGPSAADRSQIGRIGDDAWIEEQLAPQTITDSSLNWRLRGLDAIGLRADELEGWKKKEVIKQLRQANLLRQIYSRRQLYELMVEFWTDHFNISVQKGDCWYLKVVDDREVIRPHALGNFQSLLLGSARSPAMLMYLDNQANVDLAPNENYARELLELHTVGLEAGYTQNDVRELARCFTGWTIKNHFWQGQFEFRPEDHDRGAKTVLGHQIDPGGLAEGEGLLHYLALHPATAYRLARKLVLRFVNEDLEGQASELVNRAAQAFIRSSGEIKPMLKVILLDGVLKDPSLLGLKYKRPVDFVTSALRCLNVETTASPPLQLFLERMGQPPFGWPMPDGPNDLAAFWSSNLLPRWQFALALSQNQIEGTELNLKEVLDSIPADSQVDQLYTLSTLLLGTTLEAPAREDLLSALQNSQSSTSDQREEILLASLLASPEFQWR